MRPAHSRDGGVTAGIAALAAELGDRVLVDPASTEAYRRDQCLLTPAGMPAAVVRAADAGDVVTTMRLAREHGIVVVPRGAGTGLAGAANAHDGGIVLDLSRMDTVVAIDEAARTATVQPGVRNGDLDRAARAHGLWYAPDPGSRAISTVGGNIATNAGGMCCAKYGVTADHVLTLTAVLPGGETIRTGRATRKDVAGLDLTRLLVGSEGTLAVVVEATVRLLPRPARVATAAATFPTVAQAIAATLAMTDRVRPSAVEIMDRATVAAVNAMTRMGLDATAGAVMLVRCDGPYAAEEVAACAAAAGAHGATEVLHTADEDEGDALMEARRAALPALERLGTTLLDDVCVPVHRLGDLHHRIEAAATGRGVRIGTFGHAADGNLHPTIVFDAADPAAAERARAAFDDIVDAALDLGGTVSGEHGVGALKAGHVRRQLGEVERALMARVKAAFDPTGILNPGRGF